MLEGTAMSWEQKKWEEEKSDAQPHTRRKGWSSKAKGIPNAA